MQPEFCSLTHLVKVDLSKNQLTCLPDELGNLVNLQHLDLYNNKLNVLPVSFSQLRVSASSSIIPMYVLIMKNLRWFMTLSI